MQVEGTSSTVAAQWGEENGDDDEEEKGEDTQVWRHGGRGEQPGAQGLSAYGGHGYWDGEGGQLQQEYSDVIYLGNIIKQFNSLVRGEEVPLDFFLYILLYYYISYYYFHILFQNV